MYIYPEVSKQDKLNDSVWNDNQQIIFQKKNDHRAVVWLLKKLDHKLNLEVVTKDKMGENDIFLQCLDCQQFAKKKSHSYYVMLYLFFALIVVLVDCQRCQSR